MKKYGLIVLGLVMVIGGILVSANNAFATSNECQQNEDVVIVSDSSTQVNEGNAVVLEFIHEGWTAVISDAAWIWGEEPVNPAVDVTETFTKDFTITGNPTGATLLLASDNSYTVSVNGNEITSGDSSFSSETQQSINISSEYLQSGTNTLSITVTSNGVAEEIDYHNNPAGLLYKLTVNSQTCSVPTGYINIAKLVVNDNGGTATSSDFTITLTNGDFSTSTIGSEEGNILELPYGTYSITESGEGYKASYSGYCETDSVTISGNYDGPTPTCTITNNDNEVATTTEPEQKNHTSSGSRRRNPATGEVLGLTFGQNGQVLGETSCPAGIGSYMKFGWANNVDDVKKLQAFLNQNMQAGLPVTGFFGPLTRTAVEKFQEKHPDQTLAPWVKAGLLPEAKPTGYVYKTTLAWMNALLCGTDKTYTPPMLP